MTSQSTSEPEIDEATLILGCLGGIAFIILLLVYSIVGKAFVLVTLWHWFFVQPHGAPNMPIAMAIGIGLIVSLLARSVDWDTEKATKKGFLKIVAKGFGYPLLSWILFLIIGWIAAQFI